LESRSINSEQLVPSQRRLQRPPDFTGDRLTRFTQVFVRHGLVGALLGAACLFVPEMRTLLHGAVAAFIEAPLRYMLAGCALLTLMLAYAWYLDRRLDAASVAWMLYLLGVSIWEEWVFRLALPYFGAAQGLELRSVIIASNVAFGLMHYFTLRWKWQWCVAACLGGLALSRNFYQQQDLALIIALHWAATFINTPRMPGSMRP